MNDDLQQLYARLGEGAAIWSGEAGLTLEPGRWVALSGATSAEYNVALVYGPDAAAAIRKTIDDIAKAKVPALLMLAGPALGDAQELVEAGWVCVGALPFMGQPLTPGMPVREIEGSLARRLTSAELAGARALIEEAFGTPAEIAAVALPDAATTRPGDSVWGLFNAEDRLVSCAAIAIVDDTLIGWSMATDPNERRRGYGAALVTALLADAGNNGVTYALHHSSYAGEPAYRAIGYAELGRLQLWSRRRWVLARD